ncbi:MAG: FAD-dependent oxidoreductase [Candidatus Saccharibacteria bacterium]|nr:FAD-dependent oxidoreductase [Candidatus Saccharibacteria bacterium]
MKMKFLGSRKVAEQAHSFRFEKSAGFTYMAGQFVELTLPHDNPDDRGTKRWFTLSSSPTEDHLAVTTKIFQKPSTFKAALSSLTPGDKVEISQPMGDFVLPRNQRRPVLFVAGGIGVTPYRSMCQFLRDKHEDRRVTLLYAAKNEADFAFLDLFEETTRLEKHMGALDADVIKARAEAMGDPSVYISGPEPLVEKLYDQLKDDFSQTRLLRDYFPNYSVSST